MRRDAEIWCTGRSWILRAPLLFYFAYAALRQLVDPYYQDPILSGLTLVVHDLGHAFFSYFGEGYAALGGTVLQILAPVYLAWWLVQRRSYFAAVISLSWLAFSLFGVALYIGDASAMQMPHLYGAQVTGHEWNSILASAGLTYYEKTIAAVAGLAAFSTWTASALAGGWLCYNMAVRRPYYWIRHL